MRRFALWTSIVAFVLFAVSSAIPFVVPRFAGSQGGATGGTFYTPYSTTTSLSWQIVEVAMLVSPIVLPIGLLAASAYMAMAEGELRSLRASRGFEVTTVQQAGRDA